MAARAGDRRGAGDAGRQRAAGALVAARRARARGSAGSLAFALFFTLMFGGVFGLEPSAPTAGAACR